jgi:hypothetical protein
MWAAALYVVGGAIAAFGVRVFGLGNGQRNGRLNSALWTVAAGVLWPVLLLGVIEAVVIAGAVWCARLTLFHAPPVETARLDEGLEFPQPLLECDSSASSAPRH